MAKYKLIYICENDLSLQIGGTIHVKEVLASLAKIHHDITLIAPDYHGEKITIDYNIKTIFVKTWNVTIIKWLYFYIASTFYILRLFLKSQKIIVYSREMSYNIFLPILTKLLHIPLFIELNGVLLKEMEDLNYSKLSYHFTKWIEKFIFKSANNIVAVSDEIKSDIHKIFKMDEKKITVIPNGADIKVFYPISITESRQKLIIDKSKYIIGFIGSCYPFHDIDTLISSIPQLKKLIPELLVIIVGDGYMLDSWKKLANKLNITDFISFTGRVPYNQANLYINSFDICFGSDKNGTSGFPMKTLHYLSCNKPIITSNIESITKYYNETKFFKFIEPENSQVLADTVYNLYLKRSKPIKEHREIIINNYTWDHTAKNIIKTINETLCAA